MDVQEAVTNQVQAGLSSWGLSGQALTTYASPIIQSVVAGLGDNADDTTIQAAVDAAVQAFTLAPHRTHGIRDGDVAQQPAPAGMIPGSDEARLVAAYGPAVLTFPMVKKAALLRMADAKDPPPKPKSRPVQQPSLAELKAIYPAWESMTPSRRLQAVNTLTAHREKLARSG